MIGEGFATWRKEELLFVLDQRLFAQRAYKPSHHCGLELIQSSLLLKPLVCVQRRLEVVFESRRMCC